MEFVELSQAEFNCFRESYPEQNLWQSVSMCNFKKEQSARWEISYVGLKEMDQVVACAALVSTNIFLKYKYYTCLRGFMIDYSNLALVEKFVVCLKDYLHKNNCLYFTMDPYYPYQSHDKEGNPTDEFKNDALLNVFTKHSFAHLGFRNQYDSKYEPRWISILNLKGRKEEEVLKEMTTHTRRNIQATTKAGIKLRELKEDEYQILIDLVSNTGERKNFDCPTQEYYQLFKKNFKDDMKVMYAYLDTEDYVEKFLQEKNKYISELETLAKQPESKKTLQRRKEKENLLNVATKRYEEGVSLLQEYGKEIPLAAAMFVETEYEIVYLFGGSNANMKSFKGSYAIQWHMICETIRKDIPRYNFYGISGDFSSDAHDYGVYLFKKGFNAEVIELLGNFEYIDRKGMYSIYQLLRKIKHGLKR